MKLTAQVLSLILLKSEVGCARWCRVSVSHSPHNTGWHHPSVSSPKVPMVPQYPLSVGNPTITGRTVLWMFSKHITAIYKWLIQKIYCGNTRTQFQVAYFDIYHRYTNAADCLAVDLTDHYPKVHFLALQKQANLARHCC